MHAMLWIIKSVETAQPVYFDPGLLKDTLFLKTIGLIEDKSHVHAC